MMSKHVKRQRPEPLHRDYTDPERVRAEIAVMESRLEEVGYDGDCAYEKAMIRFFENEMGKRRAWLEAN